MQVVRRVSAAALAREKLVILGTGWFVKMLSFLLIFVSESLSGAELVLVGIRIYCRCSTGPVVRFISES